MEKNIQIAGAVLAFVIGVVSTTVAIDSRYAKSQEVKQQLDEYYSRQIKLRILEIDLKQNKTPSDMALREYLIQELTKQK
jgi:acid stress-induced BolA-like protein IbaG/YrbA